ncbi:MAG: nitroreductase family protein [Actinomycetota bacterium]|nr:nitroreductase family protein [Actinomycetota bacterium]
MELRKAVHGRRMVRNYRDGPVPREVVERLTDLARRAPSAGFSQGQYFVVVSDQDLRTRIAELAEEEHYVTLGFPRWISRAPVHVVVCTREEDYHERYREPDKVEDDGSEIDWPVPYWYVDAGASLMLLLLGAVDEGLGAGFFGVHRLPGLQELLGIPVDVTPIGVVTLGYPAAEQPEGSARRGRKPLAHAVRWERW